MLHFALFWCFFANNVVAAYSTLKDNPINNDGEFIGAQTSINNNNNKSKRGKSRKRVARFSNQNVRSVSYQPGPNTLHRTMRTVEKGIVTSTSAAAGLYGFSFLSSDVSDIASFASVFDQYMIEGIEFIIKPVSQPSLPATSVGFSLCYIAVDYDDANAPANITEVANYSNAIILSPGQSRTIKFCPSTLTGAWNGSLQAAAPRHRVWLDMSYTNVEHYGVKVAVRQSTTTNVSSWFILARYHLVFRNSR